MASHSIGRASHPLSPSPSPSPSPSLSQDPSPSLSLSLSLSLLLRPSLSLFHLWPIGLALPKPSPLPRSLLPTSFPDLPRCGRCYATAHLSSLLPSLTHSWLEGAITSTEPRSPPPPLATGGTSPLPLLLSLPLFLLPSLSRLTGETREPTPYFTLSLSFTLSLFPSLPPSLSSLLVQTSEIGNPCFTIHTTASPGGGDESRWDGTGGDPSPLQSSSPSLLPSFPQPIVATPPSNLDKKSRPPPSPLSLVLLSLGLLSLTTLSPSLPIGPEKPPITAIAIVVSIAVALSPPLLPPFLPLPLPLSPVCYLRQI